ncbi:hypothetical protein ACWGMA_08285 [Streptomyces asiaticus]
MNTATRINWTAGTVVNFDNHGSFWGIDTIEATEDLIARERANGADIDEWHETDRVGRPLRIVRIADPDFLDTICVIPLGVGECPNCGAPSHPPLRPLMSTTRSARGVTRTSSSPRPAFGAGPSPTTATRAAGRPQ